MENRLNEDRILFGRIASGDEDAFKRVFERFRSPLLSYLIRIIKSHEDAEELTQEILLRIWTNRQSLTAVENPQHYIFVMARNKAIDYLRKASLDLRMRHQIWRLINEYRNTTEEYVFAKERGNLIAEAIYKLPRQKQTVFKLSRIDGFTHDQISVQLSISKNTVKNHIVASVKFIRNYLAQH